MMLLGATAAFATGPPPTADKAETARWMVSSTTWGFMSTISTRTNASHIGDAFGNPYSFADASNGIPYFYVSGLDASMVDLFGTPKANPRASLALSEATIRQKNGTASEAACAIGNGLGDPENPPCARVVLSGTMVKLAAGSVEEKTAHDAIFARHPSFKYFPADHDWYITKLEIEGVWLIDFYGGAAIIKPADYFNASAPAASPIAVNDAKPSSAIERATAARLPFVGAPPFFQKVGPSHTHQTTLHPHPHRHLHERECTSPI